MALLGLYDVALAPGLRLPAAALWQAGLSPRTSPPSRSSPPSRPRASRRRRRLSIPWLIGVARHKLVDHWRRQEREERNLQLAYDSESGERRPVGRAARRPQGTRRAGRPRTTSSGGAHAALRRRVCRCPRSPSISAARCTPPRRCWCAPAGRFAVSYEEERRPAMSDAFDVLGLPVEPIDPDPAFAARLRTQLQDALLVHRQPPRRRHTHVRDPSCTRPMTSPSPTSATMSPGRRHSRRTSRCAAPARRSTGTPRSSPPACAAGSTKAPMARSGTPNWPSATPC